MLSLSTTLASSCVVVSLAATGILVSSQVLPLLIVATAVTTVSLILLVIDKVDEIKKQKIHHKFKKEEDIKHI